MGLGVTAVGKPQTADPPWMKVRGAFIVPRARMCAILRHTSPDAVVEAEGVEATVGASGTAAAPTESIPNHTNRRAPSVVPASKDRACHVCAVSVGVALWARRVA